MPIFCTLTMFTAWMSTRQVVTEARNWVNHTEDVISSADQVHSKLLQLESDLHRHFLINTGQDLSQYRQTRLRIMELSEWVYQKVADNAIQQGQWQSIQTLLNTRFEYLSELFVIQQAPLKSDPNRLKSLVEEEGVMNDLRRELKTFRDEERALLAQREQKLEAILDTSMIAAWALLLGSLTSSFAAVYLFRGLDSAHEIQGLELQRNQRMLNAIANSVVDGVITLDAEGRVIQLNRSAQKMLGYDHSTSYPLALSKLVEIQSQNVFGENEGDSQTSRFLETQGYRQDRTTFPLEMSISQTSVQNQRLLIIRDISDRYQAQQHLENYAQELEHLNDILRQSNIALTQRNEELSQFAYLTSHDLKAPLRAITNLSTWIEEDSASQLSTESKKLFQLLRGRAHRLEKLIAALAFYVQLGQTLSEVSSVNVGDLLYDIIASHPQASTFTFNLPETFPIISTHKHYLKTIFLQLIDNAIQFHPNRAGTIQIEMQEETTAWQFSVSDDGNGIEPRYHQRIFEVFQTLHARDQIETTGIGLAIVAKILQIVGGQISVTSSPGHGATFKFLWPK
ncbi:MAG: PAS domain S-box protein [Acaryochloridaceae cyanobacterium RL_2_7]|nr:PAS domain S-box protein [Acaryochloridaceae cyanobacterium RL_2_7]